MGPRPCSGHRGDFIRGLSPQILRMTKQDQPLQEISPLVSVVICYFNEADVLSEAIESVLEQDYLHIEIILVNDGSTDSSEETAIAYQDRYPEKIIRCHHPGNKNRGLSASRNLGIRHASGEWICFLDADDVFFPTKVSAQHAMAQAYPEADMIAGATLYNYSLMPQNRPNNIVPVGTAQNRLVHPPELLFDLYPLGTGQAPCMHSLFVRKSAIERVGGFEDAFRGMYEDQVFLTKIYLQCAVFVTDTCHCEYRLRPGSMMHQSESGKAYRNIRRRYLNWAEQYIRTKYMDYPAFISLVEERRKQNGRHWIGWIVHQGRNLWNRARKKFSHLKSTDI